MRKIILGGLLASFAFTSSAQDPASPIGRWKTMDDETGKAMTVTEIYQAKNGTLAAKIVENLGLPANCDSCSGSNQGKPFVGIVTLWNMKANADGTWGGGSGYKPSQDRSFNAKSMKLLDGGKKLEIKGCVAVFCKSATWVRAD